MWHFSKKVTHHTFYADAQYVPVFANIFGATLRLSFARIILNLFKEFGPYAQAGVNFLPL